MDLARLADTVYRRADRLSGGWVGTLRRAGESFGETRAAQAAAGMAYYAIFSLFPLLLVLVSATGYFVADERARREAVALVTEVIPVSRELIERNVEQVFELRGPVGIVGLVGLLWSATGVFAVLAHNVNRAWSEAELRGFLKIRLVGLAMVGVLLILLVFSLASNPLLNLIPRLHVPFLGGVSETILWDIISRVVSFLFTFLLFLTLYRWVPNTKVGWRAAVGGAVLATVGWEAVKAVFLWVIGSGIVQYELVYGSLGAVVALMVWIYLGSWITLFGAHFSAALAGSVSREERD